MKNEPTIFAKNIVIGVSTKADGDMRAVGKSDKKLKEIYKNRDDFLRRIGTSADKSLLVKVSYETDDFAKFETVGEVDFGAGMLPKSDIQTYDSLFTTTKELSLFLPLADCLGAVIYDSKNEVLGIAHLGRHGTEQFAAQKNMEYMRERFETDPRDVKIWFSPSAGAGNYPLWRFNNRSLSEVNKEQFVSAGVLDENIELNEVDTTTNENYCSHSCGDHNSRFAVAVYMR